MTRRRVVVTGLGGISAVGCTLDTIWDNLVNGRSGIGRVTAFDPTDYACKVAGEVTDFNPLDHFAKPEARKMDRYTQFAVVAAEMAIKDADLSADRVDPERVGIILGTGIGGIKETEEQEMILNQRGPSRVSPFLIPKMMPNAISGVISIRHGFKGPNFVTSSACASSAHAMGVALRSIQAGECDIVVSGGSEAGVTPLAMAGFCSLKALSKNNEVPEKASRPFDKNRDGFVLGEGGAILVFEEYESAKKRGAHIYAEVKGYAATADAYHITAPKEDGEGPARAMTLAIKDAGLDFSEVQYVNAHGTSTPYNDAIETRAIKVAFKDHAKKLAVSSTKSMAGHLLGGSAALEFLVSILSLKNQILHPTINYEEPDPECDLDYVPNVAREVKVRNFISNSLGFGGHNTCLVGGLLP